MAVHHPFGLSCPSLPANEYRGRGRGRATSSAVLVKSQLRPTKRRSFSITFSETATEKTHNWQSTTGGVASVPVRVAHELIQAGHHYLDVRTSDEYSGGHVVGAVNVPFMLRYGAGMSRNPKFVEQVLDHFGIHDEIIVGCQLGKSSIMAASELLSIGFTGITEMAGGYDVWVQNGLPSTE